MRQGKVKCLNICTTHESKLGISQMKNKILNVEKINLNRSNDSEALLVEVFALRPIINGDTSVLTRILHESIPEEAAALLVFFE